jgi:chromosome partitioning protein
MIILTGSQKGGCGKSTTAVNLCAELAGQGHDVVLVDADRQATAANWAMDRADNPTLAADARACLADRKDFFVNA